MAMNWTQYILSKLAEECTEVSKEALKNQQQGVGGEWQGKPAIYTVRSEFYEAIALMQMLGDRPDVEAALGSGNYILPPIEGNSTFNAVVANKKAKVCYYALFAYTNGNLSLTETEFDHVYTAGVQWGAQNNMAYCGHIQYRLL